jgi:septation ring formation regulator EzrA
MNALERLLELQGQGLSEQETINNLQQEGFQMREINDSLNQAKIKRAISQETEPNNQGYPETLQTNQQYMETNIENISGERAPQEYAPQEYAPQEYAPQEYAPQEYANGQINNNYSNAQNYGGYYPANGINNTETMTDIAEQVINKKTQEISKKLDELIQVKNKSQQEIEDLKERIKRIENNFDSIQKSIIGKIGEFGESTKMIHKDLDNLHGTMSKMMNPLIDNYNELKKFNSKNN